MTLKRVVLPAPFGPMMPTSDCSATCRSTCRRAVSPPKRLLTLASSSNMALLGWALGRGLLAVDQTTGACCGRRPGRSQPTSDAPQAAPDLGCQALRHEADDDDQQHAIHN